MWKKCVCIVKTTVNSNLPKLNNKRSIVSHAFKTESKLFESSIKQTSPCDKIGRHLVIKRVENNDLKPNILCSDIELTAAMSFLVFFLHFNPYELTNVKSIPNWVIISHFDTKMLLSSNSVTAFSYNLITNPQNDLIQLNFKSHETTNL